MNTNDIDNEGGHGGRSRGTCCQRRQQATTQ